MKIVLMGGNGLIGTKTMEILRVGGHEVSAASPRSGVNAITGEGLEAALAGADVVIDVTNSPSYENSAVMEFFTKSTRNLLQAEEKAGVRHHIVVSIVGADGLPDSGYMRAKTAQEGLIKAGKIPYTIIRATQFFEFLGGIAQAGAEGDKTRLSTGGLQAIAADDVAKILAEQAVAVPLNGIMDIAGPDWLPMSDFIAKYLKATGSKIEVIPDAEALYFGTKLGKTSLTPVNDARLGETTLEIWLKKQPATANI